MTTAFRIIENIDGEPEPLRSDLRRLVERAVAEFQDLFPAENETPSTAGQ